MTECNPVSQQREKYFGFSLFSCLFSPSHECLVPFYLCIFDKDRKFCPMAPAYEWKYNSKLFVTRKVDSCPLTVLNFFQFQAVGQPEFECATPPITFDRRASAQVASQGNLYWLQALSDWQRFANKCCLMCKRRQIANMLISLHSSVTPLSLLPAHFIFFIL